MVTTLSKFRRRARRTVRITLAWLVVCAISAVYESSALADHGLSVPYWAVLQGQLWTSLLGGVLLGGGYVFLLHDRLRKIPFLPDFAIIAAVILAGTVIADLALMHYHRPWNRPVVMVVLEHFLYWTALMGCTMLMLRLNDHYGGGSATYLLDRYSRPRQELRIFMFLDLRSSTSVAESIGDTRYFQLLNDLYADITDPVVYSEGNIYQYVGDEVSVTWRLERGLRNDRCIRCFFAIRAKLRSRAEYYGKQYGIEPVFKAGFHVGRVTTGEVGIVKKQTIYSGDVVNTAAHIQASCNQHGVDNLLSKDLFDMLTLSAANYTVRPIGFIPLKGKRNAVELLTVDLVHETAAG